MTVENKKDVLAVGRQNWKARSKDIKSITTKMADDGLWDTIHAKDLDPKIVEFVSERIIEGDQPEKIIKALGLPGGKLGKPWKKIQAHFRQGFRADAEAYLYEQTHRFYKVLHHCRELLEDAFENGTPHVSEDDNGYVHITRVKGITPELTAFIKNYSDAIAMPVKLWKDYGAIGEKERGPGGVTFVIENNIPLPSPDEILRHQKEIQARVQAIPVESKVVES